GYVFSHMITAYSTQMSNLRTNPVQWTQTTTTQPLLRQSQRRQCQYPGQGPYRLDVLEIFQLRGVVLCHHHSQWRSLESVIGAVAKQLLTVWAILQLAIHSQCLGYRQVRIPQGTRTPALIRRLYHEITTGQRCSVSGIQAFITQH